MIRYFAAHPTAANLLMLILLAMGLLALPQMKRETFPEFTARAVQVQAVYPGASAETIEAALCSPIEDALDGVSNIAELRCEAREGMALAVVEMLEGAELATFMDDVTRAVEAIDSFPDQVERLLVEEQNRTDRVVALAVSGPMSAPDLKAYCEGVKDRLLLAGGIPQVSISGFSEHQFRVELNEAVLRSHGLDAATVANTIRRQSLDAPLGTLEGDTQELLVRLSDERRSIHALEQLVVLAGNGGAELRLGDIATIRDTFADDSSQVLFDGERACLLTVTKNRSQDTLRVFDAVASALEQERASAPPSVSYTLTQDSASIVRARLSLLVTNGLQGLVLVLLTLWLFFGSRYAFWVAMGLPVSFMAGLLLMLLLGQSINMISMVALLVALGLLMDDAIVLAENIAAHRARGKSTLDAAIDGTRQVAPGVLSSFLTTLAVFAPLAFIGGQMGAVLRVIPIVLIVTLLVSLVEAFLILPHHLHHSLEHAAEARENALRRRFEAGLDWLRESLAGRAVDWVIRWRYLSLGAMVALLLISLGLLLGGQLKFQGFPSIDGDRIEARVLLPQGTPLARTEAVVAELSRALQALNAEVKPQQPGQADLVQHVMVSYGVNSDAHESGPHLATLSVDLLSTELRTLTIRRILNRWRELSALPADVINVAFIEPTRGPSGLAIDIRLRGSDLEEMKAASLALQGWLGAYAGVSDLADDLRPGKPELRLTLLPGALDLGVDANTVAAQLRAALLGTSIAEVRVGAEAYTLELALAREDRDQIDDLERFVVRTPAGQGVPLVNLAAIELERGLARIQRIDGRRTVTLQGNLDTSRNNAQALLNHTKKVFLPQLAEQFPGVQVIIGGEAKENAKTGGSMLSAFAIGLLGIFIILSFEFRNYREPLLVMAIIPLALIGVFWGHYLMGLVLSMPSMIGLVSLAGIAVNDSILLVAFIREGRAAGLTPIAAAEQASRARFRAILLTSTTTIAGLLPILSERSTQAQVLTPLVASIAFGLLATTLLVLFLVPALYVILHDLGWTREVETRGEEGEAPAVAS